MSPRPVASGTTLSVSRPGEAKVASVDLSWRTEIDETDKPTSRSRARC